jgi:hypothetical protein
MPTERIFRRHFYWIVETLLPNTQGLTTFISIRCPTELDLPAGLHAHQRLITSPRRSEKWNSFHDIALVRRIEPSLLNSALRVIWAFLPPRETLRALLALVTALAEMFQEDPVAEVPVSSKGRR